LTIARTTKNKQILVEFCSSEYSTRYKINYLDELRYNPKQRLQIDCFCMFNSLDMSDIVLFFLSDTQFESVTCRRFDDLMQSVITSSIADVKCRGHCMSRWSYGNNFLMDIIVGHVSLLFNSYNNAKNINVLTTTKVKTKFDSTPYKT
jgi:hypothetical protein